MLDAELVFDENCDDIRARSSHSASICFRRVQMNRSITKTVLFHTPKKYDFTRRSLRDLISYFFTPQKSTILPLDPMGNFYFLRLHLTWKFAPRKTSYRTFARSGSAKFSRFPFIKRENHNHPSDEVNPRSWTELRGFTSRTGGLLSPTLRPSRSRRSHISKNKTIRKAFPGPLYYFG